jgi:hypothetical protein
MRLRCCHLRADGVGFQCTLFSILDQTARDEDGPGCLLSEMHPACAWRGLLVHDPNQGTSLAEPEQTTDADYLGRQTVNKEPPLQVPNLNSHAGQPDPRSQLNWTYVFLEMRKNTEPSPHSQQRLPEPSLRYLQSSPSQGQPSRCQRQTALSSKQRRHGHYGQLPPRYLCR